MTRRRYREPKLPPEPTCIGCGKLVSNPRVLMCAACANERK